MKESRWSRIGELFEAVVDLEPDEQEARLRKICDDPALIREVLSLASEDRDTINVLDSVGLDAAQLVDELWAVGKRVGPYTIVRRIGEGGMGSVFLAERTDGEFEQQVALKLVRPGKNTADFERRFRSERQILARLQHPNIARLLDGGVTETGQLFFAMEYIKGDPIDVYCDRKRLSIDGRLDLFAMVCRAVHYAHQNLVVHRDLKPENILVNPDGNVKLLDFGIARLLEGDSESVRTGGAPMTPEYASPEQIRGEPLGTSSDLYSLGVILYELLAGRRPYAFEGRAPGQVARVVLDSKVVPPSTVVRSTRTDRPAAERVSRARATVPDRLQRRLSGDLDMICLKALRKEPQQRYGTASELAEDVSLHRRGLPVTARPYTASYRMQKFIARHRVGVIAVSCALIAAWGIITYYTLQLREERNRAQVAAFQAESVADFLKSIFEVADPLVAQGETVTARELLDDGARRIDTDLADVPEVQAQMMGVIGDVYMGLGLYASADTLYESALQRIRGVHEDDRNPEVVRAINRLAVIRRLQGDYAASERFAREAVDAWESGGDEETPGSASAMNSLAEALRVQGRYDEAEVYYRRALDIRRSLFGEEHRDIADNLNNLSLLLQAKGDLQDAERMQRDALAMRRKLFGERHPDVSNSINNLAVLLRETADYKRAESLFVYGLSLRREVLGGDEPRTVNTLKNLGILYADMGDYPAAEETLGEALLLFRRRLSDEHPQVTSTRRYLASVMQAQGRYDEARDLYRQVLQTDRRTLGNNHPEVANAMSDLAGVLRMLRDYDEAERLNREALRIRREVFGNEHSGVTTSLNHLAVLLAEQGRFEEAEPLYREAVEIRKRTLGADHPRVAVPLTGLAALKRERGALDESEQLFRESLELHRSGYGEQHERTAHALMGLASVLSMRGAHDEALPLLREAVLIRRDALGPEHWRTAQAESALGACLLALGRIQEAEPLVTRGYERLRDSRGADAPETLRSAEIMDALAKVRSHQ